MASATIPFAFTTRVTDVFRRAHFAIPKNPEPDFEALNVFFRLGTFLDGDTAYKGVKADIGPVEIAPYVHLSREAAMDAYIDLFRAAVSARITDGPSGLGLSGGRDSRHIALELERQGVRPLAFTSDPPGSPSELESACRVVEYCGWDHLVIRPKYTVDAEIAKNHATGFASMQHAWMYSAMQAIHYRLPDVLWDGIGGDVLSAGLFLTERNVSLFEEGRLDELAEDLTLGGDIPLVADQSLFPRDVALHRVVVELRKHVNAANPVGSFFFWSRTRRDIGASAFGIVGHDRVVLTPYLDRDLWTLLAGLPARILLSQTFHTDTIARAYPQAADLPYAGKHGAFPLAHRLLQVFDFAKWIYGQDSFGPLLDVPKARLVTARAFIPKYSSDIAWLKPIAVYLAGLLH